MSNIEQTQIEQAKAELIRRGFDPAFVEQIEADAKQEKAQQTAEWEKKTQKRLQENKRYPVKLDQIEGRFHFDACSLNGTLRVYETTGCSHMEAAERLVTQVINTQHQTKEAFNANSALGMLNGLAPENTLEGMLCTQMVSCHNTAQEFLRRATTSENPEAIDRQINRATKLMRTFTAQMEALTKLRNKGQQKITVQHVQVADGGQAIIGDFIKGKAHG